MKNIPFVSSIIIFSVALIIASDDTTKVPDTKKELSKEKSVSVDSTQKITSEDTEEKKPGDIEPKPEVKEALISSDTLHDDSGRTVEIKKSKLKTGDTTIPADTMKEALKTDTVHTDTLVEKVKPEIDAKKSKVEMKDTLKTPEKISIEEIVEEIVCGDTLFDKFGRVKKFTEFKLKLNKAKDKKIRIPQNIITYTYEDEVYKTLGALHVAMGSIGLGTGIAQLIVGIATEYPPTIVFSSIPIVLGCVEIGVGAKCLKIRKKFFHLHKEPSKYIKKIYESTQQESARQGKPGGRR